jgi:hypothetical protein
MAAFTQFKKELDELKSQGYPTHQAVETFVEQYTRQADEAERLLREKQTIEVDERNGGVSSGRTKICTKS